jgi:MFS transporter, SP family, arabinose:H+ symporter
MTGTSQEQTAGSRTFVYLVSAVAALGGFLFGFDTAVINGAILFLRRAFSLTELQTEIAAASLLVGCIVGASSGGTFSD